jgi:MtaA/CmuA family methyltransferase
MTRRERVLAMLGGKPVDRLPLMPITMMYAADQIGVKYGQYAMDFKILVAAQLATAEKFQLDYVSCISDPAREAADCGAQVHYFDDQPPGLDEHLARLTDKTELARLKVPDPLGGGRMHDRVKAAELFKAKTGGDLLIEGWVEGPCAQGADLRGINTLMTDFFDDPDFVEDLFDFVVELEIRFAKAQIEAGADIIGMGDAAASLVGPKVYQEFVLPREKKMVDAIHAMGAPVRLHICGNTRRILEGMGKTGCDMIDLDLAALSEGREKMGPNQVLLGNIHPVHVLRDGTPESVYAAIGECHRQAGPHYIIGAGCEVPRGTPLENMMALVEYAKNSA